MWNTDIPAFNIKNLCNNETSRMFFDEYGESSQLWLLTGPELLNKTRKLLYIKLITLKSRDRLLQKSIISGGQLTFFG